MRKEDKYLEALFGMAEAYKILATQTEKTAKEWLKKHKPKHPLLAANQKKDGKEN